MPPTRIRFLRHAEEHGSPGLNGSGCSDFHSLTLRGWQRAGALVRFLTPRNGEPLSTVFASKIGPGSETKRPQETAEPLMALLGSRCDYVTDHLKPDVEALMRDVLRREGEVIVFWEHSRLPDCLKAVTSNKDVPAEWPKRRYDLVWTLSRAETEWDFSVSEQSLLAGDAMA